MTQENARASNTSMLSVVSLILSATAILLIFLAALVFWAPSSSDGTDEPTTREQDTASSPVASDRDPTTATESTGRDSTTTTESIDRDPSVVTGPDYASGQPLRLPDGSIMPLSPGEGEKRGAFTVASSPTEGENAQVKMYDYGHNHQVERFEFIVLDITSRSEEKRQKIIVMGAMLLGRIAGLEPMESARAMRPAVKHVLNHDEPKSTSFGPFRLRLAYVRLR